MAASDMLYYSRLDTEMAASVEPHVMVLCNGSEMTSDVFPMKWGMRLYINHAFTDACKLLVLTQMLVAPYRY